MSEISRIIPVNFNLSEITAGRRGEHNWRTLRITLPQNMKGAEIYRCAFELPNGEVVRSESFTKMSFNLKLWQQVTEHDFCWMTVRGSDKLELKTLGMSPRIRLKFLPSAGGEEVSRDDSLDQSEAQEILRRLQALEDGGTGTTLTHYWMLR